MYSYVTDTIEQLFKSDMIGDTWSEPTHLKEFSDTSLYQNVNYPFMMPDGKTFYFAATGKESLGGYDIFRTRYDVESSKFLKAENIGMPFNSTANDYMMAINEVANLGWFVSDRNQPQGKVCVYVFIPNVDKKRVDVGSIGYARALEIANLSSIAATQTDADAVRRAHQQMAMLLYVRDTTGHNSEFLFVIDDLHDYKSLDEFRSAEARELFSEWQERVKQHNRDIEQLAAHRDEYARSSAAAKQSMRQTILLLENKVEEDDVALKRMEYDVRRIEQAALYGNDN